MAAPNPNRNHLTMVLLIRLLSSFGCSSSVEASSLVTMSTRSTTSSEVMLSGEASEDDRRGMLLQWSENAVCFGGSSRGKVKYRCLERYLKAGQASSFLCVGCCGRDAKR